MRYALVILMRSAKQHHRKAHGKTDDTRYITNGESPPPVIVAGETAGNTFVICDKMSQQRFMS